MNRTTNIAWVICLMGVVSLFVYGAIYSEAHIITYNGDYKEELTQYFNKVNTTKYDKSGFMINKYGYRVPCGYKLDYGDGDGEGNVDGVCYIRAFPPQYKTDHPYVVLLFICLIMSVTFFGALLCVAFISLCDDTHDSDKDQINHDIELDHIEPRIDAV